MIEMISPPAPTHESTQTPSRSPSIDLRLDQPAQLPPILFQSHLHLSQILHFSPSFGFTDASGQKVRLATNTSSVLGDVGVGVKIQTYRFFVIGFRIECVSKNTKPMFNLSESTRDDIHRKDVTRSCVGCLCCLFERDFWSDQATA